MNAAQKGLQAKEKELQELTDQVAQQEAHTRQISRETGARDKRVNVATLKGPPPTEQVGADMATAISRRQQRRRDGLHHKVNKLQTKLGEILAVNKRLKLEIDNLRLARLHHLEAVRMGGSQVGETESEIDELIVGSPPAGGSGGTTPLQERPTKGTDGMTRAPPPPRGWPGAPRGHQLSGMTLKPLRAAKPVS